ncbi:MAG: OmpA family protein [Desulfobacterales bacterium]
MLRNNSTKILKNQLELSERKRIQLQKMLARKTVDEEIPLWSMVDLMTLLLVFFLFLHSMSLKKTTLKVNHPDTDQPTIEIKTPPASQQPLENESVAEPDKKTDPEPVFTTNKNSALDKAIHQLRTEVLNVVDEKDKDVFSVRREENRLVFVLGERITFREGEATLLEAYHSISKKIAGFIASKKGCQVVISGHTDNTPINTEKFPSNLELSAARAINVANSLINNGVSPARVSIQGFSEYQPLFDNTLPENRQANRRVEISLINERNQIRTSAFN